MNQGCWQQLGISPTSQPEVIRQAFLAAMKSAQSLADRHAQSEQVRNVRHAYDEALRQARRIHSQEIELQSDRRRVVVEPSEPVQLSAEQAPAVSQPPVEHEGLATAEPTPLPNSAHTNPIQNTELVPASAFVSTSAPLSTEPDTAVEPALAAETPSAVAKESEVATESEVAKAPAAQPIRTEFSIPAAELPASPANTADDQAEPSLAMPVETAVALDTAHSPVIELLKEAHANASELLEWCQSHCPQLYPLFWCMLHSENRLTPELVTQDVYTACSALERLGLPASVKDEITQMLDRAPEGLDKTFIEWLLLEDGECSWDQPCNDAGLSTYILKPTHPPDEQLYINAWKLCNEGEAGLQALVDNVSPSDPISAFIDKVIKQRAAERLDYWKKQPSLTPLLQQEFPDSTSQADKELRDEVYRRCLDDDAVCAMLMDWFSRYRAMPAFLFNEIYEELDCEVPRHYYWSPFQEDLKYRGLLNYEFQPISSMGYTSEFLLMFQLIIELNTHLARWQAWIEVVKERDDFEEALALPRLCYPPLMQYSKHWIAPPAVFSERLPDERELFALIQKDLPALSATPYTLGHLCIALQSSSELSKSEIDEVSGWLNTTPILAVKVNELADLSAASHEPWWYEKKRRDTKSAKRANDDFVDLMKDVGQKVFLPDSPCFSDDQLCLMQAIKDSDKFSLALRYLMALMLYRTQQLLLQYQRRERGWIEVWERPFSRLSVKATLMYILLFTLIGAGLYHFKQIPLDQLERWGSWAALYLGFRRAMNCLPVFLLSPLLFINGFFPYALLLTLFIKGRRLPSRFGPSAWINEQDLKEFQRLLRGEGNVVKFKKEYQLALESLEKEKP
ncbi:hypothetical protein ACKC9G_17315 [Pokkaliibacter sp. CJK22405]|uniref:hypothetical protein n=1 Tax=Pokkaliibacter sp. CJK22405 TaxID=3384615 RepID=UPI00398524EC